MIRVGITGGIGSGKSTIASIFEIIGIPIYNADIEAKRLMNSNPFLIKKITTLFGSESYTNGTLNRKYIGSIVFENPELLKQLNSLVHPAVAKDSLQWHKDHKDAPYTLYESALIYETKSEPLFDKIITVYANQKTCIDRVRKRNNLTRKEVLSRIRNQMSPLLKKKKADFVIKNNGDTSLISQVLSIHHELLIR